MELQSIFVSDFRYLPLVALSRLNFQDNGKLRRRTHKRPEVSAFPSLRWNCKIVTRSLDQNCPKYKLQFSLAFVISLLFILFCILLEDLFSGTRGLLLCMLRENSNGTVHETPRLRITRFVRDVQEYHVSDFCYSTSICPYARYKSERASYASVIYSIYVSPLGELAAFGALLGLGCAT